MVGEDLLPKPLAVITLALLAWALPALLVVAQTLLDSQYSGWGYFTDLTVYCRFLIAVAVMVATERYADGRMNLLARHFRESHLIADDGVDGFQAALATADRRSESVLSEVLLFAVALAWSALTVRVAVDLAGSGWEGSMVAGGIDLSWPGQAARFVSNPLFLFLVLRWIWRFILWTGLLIRISRLPLQLSPMHPDGSGGLGFLTIYPTIFIGFVFAMSCVVASSFLKDLSYEHHSSQTVWFAIGGWLALCLVLFVGPLLVFSRSLYTARDVGLLEYGRLANQVHLAFHRTWIEEPCTAEELLNSPEPSALTDLNASVTVLRDLRTIPVDRVSLTRLLVAAGVPMLAVVAKQVPLAELVKVIVGAVF